MVAFSTMTLKNDLTREIKKRFINMNIQLITSHSTASHHTTLQLFWALAHMKIAFHKMKVSEMYHNIFECFLLAPFGFEGVYDSSTV